MLQSHLRSYWVEPAVADAPPRGRRDVVLSVVLAVIAVTETVLRSDLPLRIPSLLACLAMIAVLPWRRSHPLRAMTVSFTALAAFNVFDIVSQPSDAPPAGLFTSAAILILIYAVFRWASGAHALRAMMMMVVLAVVASIADWSGIGGLVGGFVVLLVPAELGGAARYRVVARNRAVEQAKLTERADLARDLHDTVAHHISAIVVQAQAGRAVAPSDPQAAIDVLAVIETEASRTLAEMRGIVGTLRDPSTGVAMAPLPGLADIDRLAITGTSGAAVAVSRTGDVSSVGPTAATALYRIAQESVTNAVRHGRNVTRINVHLDGSSGLVGEGAVTLRVHDDGDPALPPEEGIGFGLLGMHERMTSLGGSLEAGPDPAGGWSVTATLTNKKVHV